MITIPKIENYIAEHTTEHNEVLGELERETNVSVLHPQMLSGNVQGRLLSIISKIIQPKAVLEIGTYTGYSAICLAEGLHSNGQLHTIDKNDEIMHVAEKYFEKAGVADKITLHAGDAIKIIPVLEQKWDLVFIDADKKDYCNYYELVIENVNAGGIILVDNVLWYGKVADVADENDLDTKEIQKFNKKVQNDMRVENLILPLRDGISVIRKK